MLATPLEQGNGIQKRPGTLRQHLFFLREGVAGAHNSYFCSVLVNCSEFSPRMIGFGPLATMIFSNMLCACIFSIELQFFENCNSFVQFSSS